MYFGILYIWGYIKLKIIHMSCRCFDSRTTTTQDCRYFGNIRASEHLWWSSYYIMIFFHGSNYHIQTIKHPNEIVDDLQANYSCRYLLHAADNQEHLTKTENQWCKVFNYKVCNSCCCENFLYGILGFSSFYMLLLVFLTSSPGPWFTITCVRFQLSLLDVL